MESQTVIKKNIKVTDIIRLFFKHDVDILPIIDSKNTFKGLILKRDLIDHSGDITFIEKSFSSIVNNFLFKPTEKEFLQIISNLNENIEFPVLNLKGQVVSLWRKKNLLDLFYGFTKSTTKTTLVPDIDFEAILNTLPVKILVTNSKDKIIFASNYFINEFDIKKEILINQSIVKIFPKINTSKIKDNFYPRIFKIRYQHKDIYYTIFNFEQKSYYIYYFTTGDESFIDFLKKESFEPIKMEDSLSNIVEEKEKEIIKKVLKESDWNISEAARILKIPRQTLQYKINKYKITNE